MVPAQKDALRKALSQSKKKDQPSWLERYVQLASCEVAKAGDLGLNFDQLIDYGTAFRTLTPIEDPLYTAQLAERLMRSGMTLNMSCICYSSSILKGSEVRVSAIDPSRLKKNGFVYCTCDAYTHYHWCIHCCGDKWRPAPQLQIFFYTLVITMTRLSRRSTQWQILAHWVVDLLPLLAKAG